MSIDIKSGDIYRCEGVLCWVDNDMQVKSLIDKSGIIFPNGVHIPTTADIEVNGEFLITAKELLNV